MDFNISTGGKPWSSWWFQRVWKIWVKLDPETPKIKGDNFKKELKPTPRYKCITLDTRYPMILTTKKTVLGLRSSVSTLISRSLNSWRRNFLPIHPTPLHTQKTPQIFMAPSASTFFGADECLVFVVFFPTLRSIQRVVKRIIPWNSSTKKCDQAIQESSQAQIVISWWH